MPLQASVGTFLASEVDRFTTGVGGLDPSRQVLHPPGSPGSAFLAGGPAKVTIPGWDDVVKLGPQVRAGSSDWSEYFKAQREDRAPNLDASIVSAIEKRLAARDANASSAQPEWSRSWGQVMTALDNVQDLLSTVATVGRLTLWAAPKLASRALPGIGWVILASDLLNLLGFFGMVAMPLYALLCQGPRQALLAGVPAAVLKNALCKEVWTQASRNPFSRKARLARNLRAAGRLPSIGNLIEVAQTTESLFGWGLSLGSLYAAAMDSIFSLAADPGGPPTQINTKLLTGSLGAGYVDKATTLTPGNQLAAWQAARVLAQAPVIAGKHDLISDDDHYAHMAALLAAVPVVSEFFADANAPAFLEQLLDADVHAPAGDGGAVAPLLAQYAGDSPGLGTWWVPGNPVSLRGADLVPLLADQVAAGVRDFLLPRRNTERAAFYGAAVTQLAEQLWLMIAQDDRAITFELSTDYKLLTALMVDGYLPRAAEDETKLWSWWTAARALSDARGGELLYPADWLRLADAAGIDLLKLLDPDAPVPEIWREYAEHPERFNPPS